MKKDLGYLKIRCSGSAKEVIDILESYDHECYDEISKLKDFGCKKVDVVVSFYELSDEDEKKLISEILCHNYEIYLDDLVFIVDCSTNTNNYFDNIYNSFINLGYVDKK